MKGIKKIKKAVAGITIAAMCLSIMPFSALDGMIEVQAATARQMESLSRGLVAVKTSSGVFLSWRLLGTESYATKFNVYRDGVKIASNISDSTNYMDENGSTSSKYFVRSVVNGVESTESDVISPWSNCYKDVPLNKPANTKLNGETVTYAANDATVADVDGDGEYEIILKWDPSNAKDNSQSGYTSNVYVDCYEMDGTQRWRIDLGKNIRAGAHYTQMIAYDLNGDGKAEIAMKTADGTVAGDGKVIGDSSKDYRNSSGYVLSGPEYLTLFEGKTGKELVTIDYEPERGTVSSWGDNYGNRVDRFLAGVAYFDGKSPSLVVCRGYYTRSVIVSYEYKGGKLSREWIFDSNASGNSSYAAQGNHNLSIADVDNDGKDEVVYGSCVIDHDGKGLYTTGHGHGDALHVGDFDPTHSGLEIYQVHENKGSNIESVQFRDAKTGKTIWAKKLGKDIGRGLILNVDPDFYPYVTLASNGNYYTAGGKAVTSSVSGLGINFASYWDGDLYREGLDGTTIRKWDYKNDTVVTALTGSNVHSCNGTKSTPSLSADIIGDWREEVIWPTSDDKALRIYTTTDVTSEKLYTLMHDSQYRTAIAWQNVAYNQPPHTSYYIGPDMATPSQPAMYTVGNYKLGGVTSTGGTEESSTPVESSSVVESSSSSSSGSSTPSVTASVAHNFTTDGKNSSYFTITGNLSTSKGTVSYNGLTLKQCLKMESSTSVKFTTTSDATLALVCNADNSKNIKVDGTKYTLTNGVLTLDLAAGSHTITKGDTANLFYMALSTTGEVEESSTVASSSVVESSTVEESSSVVESSSVAPSVEESSEAPSVEESSEVESSSASGSTESSTVVSNKKVYTYTAQTEYVINLNDYISGLKAGDQVKVTADFKGNTYYGGGLGAMANVNGNASWVAANYSNDSSNNAKAVLDMVVPYDGGNKVYAQMWWFGSGSVDLYLTIEKVGDESSSEEESSTVESSSVVESSSAVESSTVEESSSVAPSVEESSTVESSSSSSSESTAVSYAHNFTTDGKNSSFFSITGNLSTSKGSVKYNGLTLTQCLKMESSTSIGFTTAADATLTLVFNSANSSNVKVDGTKYTLTNGILTLDLAAGSHTIKKADTANLFYMAVGNQVQ